VVACGRTRRSDLLRQSNIQSLSVEPVGSTANSRAAVGPGLLPYTAE